MREARFVKNADGTADGGVHALFTITGRTGATTGCTLAQPDFATQLANHNVIFRIPTPTFGAGLIETDPGCGDRGEPGEQHSPRSKRWGSRARPNFQRRGAHHHRA